MIKYRNKHIISSSLGVTISQYSQSSKALQSKITNTYDVAVIGGGSAGLAFAMTAAKLGISTVVFDYVVPSPHNSKWGLGGTCVNVGCIPKKLMHQSSLLAEAIVSSNAFGWDLGINQDANNQTELFAKFKWSVLRTNVQNYIKGLNYGYKSNLDSDGVTYLNALAAFKDANTLYHSSDVDQLRSAIDHSTECEEVKFRFCVVCTGGRPTSLGSIEDYAITSDDLFSLEQAPGKTLVVGGGYVALECAGFLAGMGYPVSMMTRGLHLRDFDQDVAQKIVHHMVKHSKINNIPTSLPIKAERLPTNQIRVTWQDQLNMKEDFDDFDTVLMAVGRGANTRGLALEKVGVHLNPRNRKIVGGGNGELEQTHVQNIYALGDVLDGCPELTPVASKSAQLLAMRLAHLLGKRNLTSTEYEDTKLNYNDFPTTVFTPLEYSCVGLTEEQAINLRGEQNIEVYHSQFSPLEEALTEKYDEEFQAMPKKVYCKIICDREQDERVLGVHYLGPNAGEVMQGFAVALKMGMKFRDLKRTVGIHPTCAEEFIQLKTTKRSGEDYEKHGC